VPSRAAHAYDQYLWSGLVGQGGKLDDLGSHKLINTFIGYGIFTAPAEISIPPGGHGRPS
jgi:hypothetical protein